MKTYWGSGGIAPLIIDPGTRWRWVVGFTPRPLYPQEKSPWYPLDRRLGGPRAVLDAVVKRKIPSSSRESNPRTPIVQPVAQRYTDWAITAQFVIHIDLNNYMEQNSSWEVDSGTACQEISHLVWKPKVHYRIHNRIQSTPSQPVSLYTHTHTQGWQKHGCLVVVVH
jgi:hypothetical protein